MDIKEKIKKEAEEGMQETSGGCAASCALIIVMVLGLALLGIVIDIIKHAI